MAYNTSPSSPVLVRASALVSGAAPDAMHPGELGFNPADLTLLIGDQNGNPTAVHVDSSPEIFNYNPQYLPNIRSALASVLAGKGRAKIAFVGDSTVRGWHAGTGADTMTNQRLFAHPFQSAKMLAAMGTPTTTDSIFGAGGDGNVILEEDARLSLGAAWSVAGVYSVGGQFFTATTGGSSWSLTPTNAWDTATVFYATYAGNGTFTIGVSGATLATVDSSVVGSGFGSKTVTKTLGVNKLDVTWTAGGPVYITGAYFYNSASPAVDVFNMGWGGSTAAQWVSSSTGYDPPRALAVVAPHLSIINLGINEWRTGVPVSSYIANIQSLITVCQAFGDVVLAVPWASGTVSAPAEIQAAYQSALYSLALSNNVPLIDYTKRSGSWDDTNALGMDADTLHPSALGQADMARGIIKLLTRI